MSRQYRFVHLDVFAERALAGNPLAVFPEGEGLADAEMQAIARELNLSETTFVLPSSRPDCQARVRIFSPSRELAFAGHPTVGTAYVLASLGRLPAEAALEERVGPVPVRLEGDDLARPSFIWMRHPPATFQEPLTDRAGCAAALGLAEADLLPDCPIVVGSTGTPLLYVPLRDRAAVDRASLDARHPLGEEVYVFALDEREPNRVYARMFAPRLGIPEDPATGAAAGPLGAYLVRFGLIESRSDIQVLCEQGTRMGRQSFLHIRLLSTTIEVGGACVPVLEGLLTLP